MNPFASILLQHFMPNAETRHDVVTTRWTDGNGTRWEDEARLSEDGLNLLVERRITPMAYAKHIEVDVSFKP